MTTDPGRLIWAALAVGLWLLSVLAVVLLRLRAKRAAAHKAAALAPPAGVDAVLVAFASQTGLAEELAWITARSLSDAGTPARVVLLGDLEPAGLKAARRLLIIASTTGEGDPPDSLSRFVRQTMKAPADLDGLSYGLLALGDRTYADYCGFGRALDSWLQRSGAQPLFDHVEVDNGDTGAIRHWQHQLGLITGSTVQADWTPPAYDRWQLVERRLLNPGSPGGEAHLLAFEPVDHAPQWAAGDIAEIGLPDAAQGSREYSVASLPATGRAEFIIRRMIRSDGLPGLASGWLTRDLAPGAEVGMRIRTNRSFHGPDAATPLILIGNGTGLAGLRAHLKAREDQPHGGAWLMFGERTRAHDALLNDELEAMLASGLLTRLDRVFSRDAGDGRYVQAVVTEQAETLKDWLCCGAAIMVCGSLEGMSKGVHDALEAVLGAEALRDLTETGRYRRDVY
ncbi:MAG: sulfite reductase subunit alpha [Brevundimonas sp.]